MNTAQTSGKTLFRFAGKDFIVNQETLQAVLKHAGIPFTSSVTATEAVVEVDPQHALKVREVVQQWYETMHVVHKEVW